MSIALYRIDDRLIHGQVVVGWGQRLNVGFIVLVDDAVRASPWEQELYRMGVPPDIEMIVASSAEAAARLPEWEADPRVGILVAGDVGTLAALTENGDQVKRINVGGIHQRPGRRERLRFVFLSDAEAEQLHQLVARGIEVTAQDVPTARAVPLAEFI
jgi:mannose/fructose/N-acetylgalactosamine-specific phosphotransferase system component IIB